MTTETEASDFEPGTLPPRIEVEARLYALNGEAQRMTRLDRLSRESRDWALTHRRINVLLDLWEQTLTAES